MSIENHEFTPPSLIPVWSCGFILFALDGFDVREVPLSEFVTLCSPSNVFKNKLLNKKDDKLDCNLLPNCCLWHFQAFSFVSLIGQKYYF
jgi:hypothetical protein